MSSNNSRRSQSVNSNSNNNSQNNQNSKNTQNSNDIQSPNIQSGRGKSKQQNKKLQQLKLNLDDLNTIFSCYQTREDNIFQMRVCIMQVLENTQGRSQFEIQNSLRHICSTVQEIEKFRVNQENQVIQKYSSLHVQPIILENNSNIKQVVYKFGSKLNKMNNAYYQKIQFYFPRMAELIQQEQCAWNSQFKESLSSVMSQQLASSLQNSQIIQVNNQYNSSATQGFGNISNQNGVKLVTYLNHVISKSRQKFQKELNKFQYYQQSYSGLIEKTVGIQKVIDKCNKNEKFYVDKYIQGSSAFIYTKYLIQRYLIKSSFKFIQLGITPQTRQIQKQFWKNPYDILQLEDKVVDNKTPIMKAAQNSSQQGNGQPISSSCVSTSKTTSTSESILEIIVTNYDKNIKEMLQSNKYINNKIRNYIESYKKRQQSLQIHSQNNVSQNIQMKKSLLNKQFQSQQMLAPPQKNHQTIGSANSLYQRNNDDLSKQSTQNQLQNDQENAAIISEVTSSIGLDQKQNSINKIDNRGGINIEQQQTKSQLEFINNQSEIKNRMSINSQKQEEENILGLKQGISNYFNSESCSVKQRIIPQSAENSVIQNEEFSQSIIASSRSKEQSYQIYLDEDIIKTQSQIFHKQMSGSNITAIDQQNKVNFNQDEQVSDVKGQKKLNQSTENGIEQVINPKYLKENYGIAENNNFYIMNSNNFKNSNAPKPREKSLTFNHTIQLDNNLVAPIQDIELQKYYTHSKNKSYQDSMTEYQFIRRMKSNDSKNNTQRTCEIEESSFQSNGNNPYRVLKPSNAQQGFYVAEDTNKINECNTLSQQMKSQSILNLNGPVHTSNLSSKQLQRVIISPFQNDIIQSNKNSNLIFTKQNGNSLSNITPKINQQKVNLNTQNVNNIINNGYNSIVNTINSNNNVNSFSQQNKTNQIRFSVTSIQKQIDLPCIEQFNQIFESKKKNLSLMCQSTQNSQTPSLILSNQTSQGQQQNNSQQISQNLKNNQNNTFSQPSNVTQLNDDTVSDSLEQKQLSKKQKQIKIFTITSREGNNLIQNGLQQEPPFNSCFNSSNMIPSGSLTGTTTPLNSQQSQSQAIMQNNINSLVQIQSNSNQKAEVILNPNTLNNQISNNTNIQNIPIIKNNTQLKMSQKLYSGPNLNSQLNNNNKNHSTTPIKSTINQKKQFTSSDQIGIGSLNINSSNLNEINNNNQLSNQEHLYQQVHQMQMQKYNNLNTDQNIYTYPTQFDQTDEFMFSESTCTQQMTPQIGKNVIGQTADNFHLLKQNYKTNQKNPFEQSNQLGQFMNSNQSNTQQPVLTRINNNIQGSFSPLKLENDSRRQTQINNQNFQLNTLKLNDNFRKQNINSAQNNVQSTLPSTPNGKLFMKGSTAKPLINQNISKNITNKSQSNNNQFVIKTNNIKNYENKQTILSANKNPA